VDSQGTTASQKLWGVISTAPDSRDVDAANPRLTHAAGRTDRVWSAWEVLRFRVPPWHNLCEVRSHVHAHRARRCAVRVYLVQHERGRGRHAKAVRHGCVSSVHACERTTREVEDQSPEGDTPWPAMRSLYVPVNKVARY
jgi:hypothetical protein